jgi:type I restriction enzyme R subunit
LGEIDFEALKAHFEKGRKRTETEKLKAAVGSKLQHLVQLTKTGTDLLEMFKKPIEEKNAGMDVDGIFEKLLAFARELNQEEERGVAEQLTEEELAVFNFLTKPKVEMSDDAGKQVKAVACKRVLTLKQAKLVLDTRKWLRTRADVLSTVKTVLDDLPRIDSVEL